MNPSESIAALKANAGFLAHYEKVQTMGHSGSRGSSMDVIELLSRTSMFSVLDEAELRSVHSEIEPVRLLGGEILFRQGDVGDGMLVVVAGRLRATLELEGGKEQILGEIGPGESVGEMAVLTGERRSATVHAPFAILNSSSSRRMRSNEWWKRTRARCC